MIKSYPVVTDDGVDTGSEISFQWKHIVGIQKLFTWDFRRGTSEGVSNVPTVVPECCTVYFGDHELNIRADYNELVQELKELDEDGMYE